LPELLPLLLPPTSLQIPGVRLEHPQVPVEVQHLLNTRGQGPGQDDTLHAPEEPPDELLPASAPLVVPPLLELAALPFDPPLLPLDPLPLCKPLLLPPDELLLASATPTEASFVVVPPEDPPGLTTNDAPSWTDASELVGVPLSVTLPPHAVAARTTPTDVPRPRTRSQYRARLRGASRSGKRYP
jgi:hypothetical protein